MNYTLVVWSIYKRAFTYDYSRWNPSSNCVLDVSAHPACAWQAEKAPVHLTRAHAKQFAVLALSQLPSHHSIVEEDESARPRSEVRYLKRSRSRGHSTTSPSGD